MRVVLVEDQFLLRDGLTRLLRTQDIAVVAALPDAQELFEVYERERPDLLLLDIRLPPLHRDEGLRAALQVRRRFPRQPVMLLSQYVERLYVDELLASGDGNGVGYLLKDRVFDAASFVRALHTLVRGGTVIDPHVIEQMLARRAHADKLARLSPREHETLVLMAEGESNQDIAASMCVSEKAVAKNINAIFTKLDLATDMAQSSRRVLAVLTYLRSSG